MTSDPHDHTAPGGDHTAPGGDHTAPGGDHTAEIGALIAAELIDGPRPVEALIDQLRDRAGASTVRAVLGAPGFVVDDGRVRLRGADEPFEVDPDLRRVRGVLSGPGWRHVVLMLPVPRLDASEPIPVNPRFAAALGVAPGTTRRFTSADEPEPNAAIEVRWPSAHHPRPDLTGLVDLATALDAEVGDPLLLRFDKTVDLVECSVVAPGSTPGVLELSELLGLDPATMRVDLAEALGVHGDRAAEALRHRGDRELSDLVAGAIWT